MTIEPIKQQIEDKMAALTEAEYRHPDGGLDDFMTDISRLIGQAKKDRTELERANFPYETSMPLYEGYLEILALEHGQRVNADQQRGDAQVQFAEGMPLAQNHRKILMKAARFVVAKSTDEEPMKVYKMIQKGRGQVDTLNDNISLVAFCTSHQDLASKINPDGQAITPEYLGTVETQAVSMLKLRGETSMAEGERNRRVDRQRRLITLLLNAEQDIKLYADAAFVFDSDRYNNDYVKPFIHAASEATTSDTAPLNETESEVVD